MNVFNPDAEDGDKAPDSPGKVKTREEILAGLQLRLEETLKAVPQPDSSEFWMALTNPGLVKVITPEVLCWAIEEFLQKGDRDKAERVFVILFLRYEDYTFALVRKRISWLSSRISSGEIQEIVETIARDSLNHLFTRIMKGYNPYKLSFYSSFALTVQGKTKDYLQKEGYWTRRSTSQPDEKDKPYRKISLSAPLSGDNTLTLEDVLEDPETELEFNIIEVTNLLKLFMPRLTSEEKEIFMLRFEEVSINQIAEMLGKDWKWVNRKLQSIRRKASEQKLVTLTPQEEARLGGKRRNNGAKNDK